MFIDAMVVKGTGKSFSCSINVLDVTGQKFIPMDLSDYSVRFRVLGSATADAEILVEHIINDYSEVGRYTDASNGQFDFEISKEDTDVLGLGYFPIQLDLLDYTTGNYADTITQGGKNGEFNRIQVIEV